jgi:ADP-ribose pyrophosphatase YjhB (NUDIX family)
MMTIQIFDEQGQAKSVSSENLMFRPAVYGIFIEQDQILLLRDQATQLLFPPGRIVPENEEPAQAIRHYFRELADIAPILGPLLFIENQYRQEGEQAWQLSVLYYAIERPSTASIRFSEDEQTQPEWLRLDELERAQFQFGYEAVQASKIYLQL